MVYNPVLTKLKTNHDAFVWMIKSAAHPKGVGYVWNCLTYWWELAFKNKDYPQGKEVFKWVIAIRYGLLLQGYKLVAKEPSEDFMEGYNEAIHFQVEEYEEDLSILENDSYYQYIACQVVS